eukprot:129-Eustigmatos_ZCMA.PRE.1
MRPLGCVSKAATPCDLHPHSQRSPQAGVEIESFPIRHQGKLSVTARAPREGDRPGPGRVDRDAGATRQPFAIGWGTGCWRAAGIA